MFRAILIGTVVALSVGACVEREPLVLTTTFDPKTVAYAKIPGHGSIQGQAFMRQMGGGVVTAAGQEVYLLPTGAYIDEYISRQIAEPSKVATLDPALKDYVKRTVADASGNFTFDKLSNGDYYVFTTVNWYIPTRYGPNRQGGALFERVTVSGKEPVKIIMSR